MATVLYSGPQISFSFLVSSFFYMVVWISVINFNQQLQNLKVVPASNLDMSGLCFILM